MNKLIFSILFGTILAFAFNNKAFARIPIPVQYGSMEKAKKVYDLPNTDEYKTQDGQVYDLGIMYSVFSIMWIPIWTTEEPQLVGYIDSENIVSLPDDIIKEIAVQNSIADPLSLVKLPLWDWLIGKIIVGIVALLILFGLFSELREKTAGK